VFDYTASHNVYELVAGETTCPADFFQSGKVATLRGAQTLGGGSGSNPNKLEIVLSGSGVRTFACEVGTHCAGGQIVTVTVGNPAPTALRNSGSSGSSRPAALVAVAAAALAGAAAL
jgi:hypothetical protein